MRRRVWSAAATMRAREAVSSAWLSALAMAVATSSVKSASRASVSGRQRSSPGRDTVTAPHNRPSTLIGTPTTERMSNGRTRSAIGPEASTS